MHVATRYRWLATALTAMLVIGMGVAAQADAKLKAKITRNAQGIPTIEAENFKCARLRLRLRVRAGQHLHDRRHLPDLERRALEWFGPDEETPEGFTNLDSDLFYQRIKDRGTVEELIEPEGADGPEEGGQADRLRLRRRATTPTSRRPASTTSPTRAAPASPGCARSPRWTSTSASTSSSSTPAAASRSTGIARPSRPAPRRDRTPTRRDAAATEEITPDEEQQAADARPRRSTSPRTPARTAGASAARRPKGGGGIVLANPHFPWQGPRRFYQTPPRDPGRDQRLRRQPVRRAADPDRPHREARLDSHRLDRVPVRPLRARPRCPATRPATSSTASPVPMERDEVTVEVKQPDGSIAPFTRTPLHDRVRAGHPGDLQPDPVRLDATRNAYAMFDANADNCAAAQPLLRHQPRAVDRRSCSTILRKYQGIPWVNTIASDSKGKALYADIGAIPNVAERQGDGVLGSARRGHLPGGRPAGARRLALGVRADDRPGLGRRRA